MKEREEKKNQKKVKKQQEEEQKKLHLKIAMEERKLLLAQRNLESIRLIAELLSRAKVRHRSTFYQFTVLFRNRFYNFSITLLLSGHEAAAAGT